MKKAFCITVVLALCLVSFCYAQQPKAATQPAETQEMLVARLQAERWAAMAREAAANQTLFEARANEFIRKYNELKAVQAALAEEQKAEEAKAEE